MRETRRAPTRASRTITIITAPLSRSPHHIKGRGCGRPSIDGGFGRCTFSASRSLRSSMPIGPAKAKSDCCQLFAPVPGRRGESVTYRLVIFDFDGTLADSASWFVKALNDLAPRHGFRPVTEAEIEMLRGRGNREIIRYPRIAQWRLPFIAADLRRRAAADAASISLFDGVERLLATLHRNGVTCAIVSSNSSDQRRTRKGNAHPKT